MNYYLYSDNQTNGPFSLEQITQKLASGLIGPETPCCVEGATEWQALGQLIPSTPPAPVPPTPAPSARFGHQKYLIRRKFFKLFGGAFHIYGPNQELVFYSKMKAFKLKEDIRLYTGEDMQTEVLAISARGILDFSLAYDVVDSSTGAKVGALKRKGLKSIMKDEWVFMDADDREIGLIQEDNWLMALLRRFLTNLIPQTYQGEIHGTRICTFSQNFNPFILKITLDFSADTQGLLDRRLGMAAAVLLCAIEGRQS
jgi:uncharacterized protein YxjI